jgi:hypothetical protein
MSYWHEIYRLTNPAATFDAHRVAVDVAWCAGFSAVFLAIGAIVFRRRDITA